MMTTPLARTFSDDSQPQHLTAEEREIVRGGTFPWVNQIAGKGEASCLFKLGFPHGRAVVQKQLQSLLGDSSRETDSC